MTRWTLALFGLSVALGLPAFPFELSEDVAYGDHLVIDALLGGS